MKNYFDVLDGLYKTDQPSISQAVSELQRRFPELSDDGERAGRIFAAWRSGFGKAHVPQEGYACSEEAEALFLYGDFLRDLAAELIRRNPAQKCTLCTFANTRECGLLDAPCYAGVEEYLLQCSSAYHKKMRLYCQAYFAFLDELQERGGYNQYEAENALKAEFPWLASHDEYAKYAMASWMHQYWVRKEA